MKALITGGAGFIGSSLAKRMLALGNEVVILDDLSTGLKENIPERAVFVQGDVADWKSFLKIDEAMHECDVVFHIAGQSSGEISYDNPARDLDINAKGTLHALEWARKRRVRKFVFASTMAIYGDAHQKLPVREDFEVFPKSFYAVSKMTSEKLLDIYRNQFDLPSMALRLFNVYGPGQNMENLRQGMASIYMAYYLSKKPIVVKGAKDRFRDFVYIDDVVDAFLAASIALDGRPQRHVINIASGSRTTVQELIGTILDIDGVRMEDYPVEYREGTPGDIFGISADVELARQHLHWKAKWDLREGLANMLNWAKGNSK